MASVDAKGINCTSSVPSIREEPTCGERGQVRRFGLAQQLVSYQGSGLRPQKEPSSAVARGAVDVLHFGSPSEDRLPIAARYGRLFHLALRLNKEGLKHRLERTGLPVCKNTLA
jgi:hypothetical protein